MGPTASGKTSLAVELVGRLPCDIVSVDSALVYRGLDIGTAKPDPELLAQAPHRLIDICDPTEVYSAARFRNDALAEMTAITSAGRIPLLVGGTMLYFRALQYGLSELPEADQAVRSRLAKDAQIHGWEEMHKRLKSVDPQAAARIHPNDPQRIQRALEVFEITGRPLSRLQNRDGRQVLNYRILKLVLTPADRTVLHRRIEARFLQMLDMGLEAEVRGLLETYELTSDTPSMRLVGYRQVLEYLLGGSDRKTMVNRGIVATRQLAKRQLTWIRSENSAHRLDEEQGDFADQVLKILESNTITVGS